MLARIRSIWLAGGGALALTVMLSGIVAAATVLTVVVAPAPAAPVVDTTATFEDLDGNGIDDDCQAAVSADPVAAASAEIAADLNGDGTISVTEAAQSGRAGGNNCNHGGYVSVIATASGDPAEAEADTETKAKDETPAECVAPSGLSRRSAKTHRASAPSTRSVELPAGRELSWRSVSR